MKVKSVAMLIAPAAVFALFSMSTANAAPFGQRPEVNASIGDSAVLPVDLRPYRHCHWSGGRRWCHGPHHDYYDYDDDGFDGFGLPFFLPFFWGDHDDYRYYRGHRDYDRREYRRRDFGGRDYGGGREGRGKGRRGRD